MRAPPVARRASRAEPASEPDTGPLTSVDAGSTMRAAGGGAALRAGRLAMIPAAVAGFAAVVVVLGSFSTSLRPEGVPFGAFTATMPLYVALTTKMRSHWRAVALIGVLAGTVLVGVRYGYPWEVSGSFAGGNVTNAALFSILVHRRWPEAIRFARRDGVVEFLTTALISTVAGAMVVRALLGLSGTGLAFGADIVLARIGADYTAILAVAPLLLLLPRPVRLDRSAWLEVTTFAVVIAGCLAASFTVGGLGTGSSPTCPWPYSCSPRVGVAPPMRRYWHRSLRPSPPGWAHGRRRPGCSPSTIRCPPCWSSRGTTWWRWPAPGWSPP